jgi:hypothetical protein
MKTAFFRFYEELNDFLPKRKRKRTFSITFDGRPSVKHVIESIGVPHTEIDLILVNSVSVDFKHFLTDQDRVSVYPVFESLDISPVVRLRPAPLRKTAFILDVQYYEEFFRCETCDRVYWKGSHYPGLKAKIERWRNPGTDP